jgi:nucleotide-binding universal stress UspA family protein
MVQSGSRTPAGAGFHIVVGVDYSDASELALRQALAMGHSRADAVVHVLAVAEGDMPERPKALHDDSVRRFEEQAHRTLEEYVSQRLDALPVAGNLDRARVRTAVEFGKPVDRILALADVVGASLIVVGTHGRGALDRLLVGSVAEGLLKRARAGVIVVRPAR